MSYVIAWILDVISSQRVNGGGSGGRGGRYGYREVGKERDRDTERERGRGEART